MEGFLCPISSVIGHVPRVLTLVTSLASSLPGDPGPGVFITYPGPHPNTHTHTHIYPCSIPQTQSSSWRKTKHPEPFLIRGTCTNWMHIHTLMHDDPSVDLCLGVKQSKVNTGLSKFSLIAMSHSAFWLITCMFY